MKSSGACYHFHNGLETGVKLRFQINCVEYEIAFFFLVAMKINSSNEPTADRNAGRKQQHRICLGEGACYTAFCDSVTELGLKLLHLSGLIR